MNEELKAIDWLRAKTISYESKSEELHYALILYNLIMNLQKENQEYKEVIDKVIECISELDDNTDDTTCYDIDKDTRDYILSILKEVK